MLWNPLGTEKFKRYIDEIQKYLSRVAQMIPKKDSTENERGGNVFTWRNKSNLFIYKSHEARRLQVGLFCSGLSPTKNCCTRLWFDFNFDRLPYTTNSDVCIRFRGWNQIRSNLGISHRGTTFRFTWRLMENQWTDKIKNLLRKQRNKTTTSTDILITWGSILFLNLL